MRVSVHVTGPADLPRELGHEQFFGQREALAAEPTADVGRDDPYLRRVETVDQQVLTELLMHALAARVDSEVVAVPQCRGAARFDRADRHARVDDALLDDDFTVVEVGLHERGNLHRRVGLGAFEEQQLVGRRLFEIDHRR